MRFRLRYRHHDIGLSEGEFELGRSTDCQLSLDDPLVSRRHALLVVASHGVTVEDLQSRNGTSVNGQRIVGRELLHAGDKIVLGSQELTLLLDVDGAESALRAGDRTLPKIAAATRGNALGGSSEEPITDPPPEPEPSTTGAHARPERRADAFSLLGGVADKALALGRADEAERLLGSALLEILQAAREGRRSSPPLVDVAARFAAKLATATSKGPWVDYVVELYDTQRRLCPAQVTDELYSAMRRVSAIDLARLRDYLARLREAQSSFGPAEKFLLQRLEGLERLAALR